MMFAKSPAAKARECKPSPEGFQKQKTACNLNSTAFLGLLFYFHLASAMN
jgi:hypothetical protein